jgi:hypothetical protein
MLKSAGTCTGAMQVLAKHVRNDISYLFATFASDF